MTVLNISNAAYYGIALESFRELLVAVEGGSSSAFDIKYTNFEILTNSGKGGSFTRSDLDNAGTLGSNNGFPEKFWNALKNVGKITPTDVVINGTKYKAGQLKNAIPAFSFSKTNWNLGNVILEAARCTPGTKPCDNFSFSTGTITTNPHQVEDTTVAGSTRWQFKPGSKEPAKTLQTSDTQIVSEEMHMGVAIESGTEYEKGGSMAIATEAKAGVNFGAVDVGGSVTTTLEDNWSQTWSSKSSFSSGKAEVRAAESNATLSAIFDPSMTQMVDGSYFHIIEYEEEIIDEDGNVTKIPKEIEVGYEPYAWYRTSIVRTVANSQILMSGKFQINDTGEFGIGGVTTTASTNNGLPVISTKYPGVVNALRYALLNGGDDLELDDQLGLDGSVLDFSENDKDSFKPVIFTSTLDAGTNHAYDFSVVTQKTEDSKYKPVEDEESKWPNLNLDNLIPSIRSRKNRAPLFRSKDYVEPTDQYLDSLGYYIEVDEMRPKGKRIEVEGDSNVNTVQLDSSDEQVAVKGFENSFITGNDDSNRLVVRASSDSNSINMNSGNDTVHSRGDNFVDLGEGDDRVVYSGGQSEFVLGKGQDRFQINKAKGSFLIDDYNPIDDFVFVGKGLDPNLLTAKLKDYVVKEERYEDDKILDHKVQFKYDGKEIGTARVDFMDSKVNDLIFNRADLHVYAALNSSAIDYEGFIGYLNSGDFTYSKAFEKLMLTSGLFKGGLVTPEDWSEMDLSEREVVVANGFIDNTYDGGNITEIASSLPDTFSNSTASSLDALWFA